VGLEALKTAYTANKIDEMMKQKCLSLEHLIEVFKKGK
jgi:hypothetical protein